MRTHNIYANRAAPSRDIAKSFATIEHLRFLCDGGMTLESERWVPHGYAIRCKCMNLFSP